MKAGCSAFGYKKIERQQLLCTIWCQSFQVITKAIINRVLVFLERIGRQKYGMTALKDTKKSEFVYNYTTVCIVMWLLFITVSPYPFPHANGADDCLMFFPVLQIQWLCFFFYTKQPQLHLTWLQSTSVHRLSIDCIHLQQIPKGQ